MAELVDLFNIQEEVDDKYTTKVNIPQYLPTNDKPSISELFNDIKYKQLLSNIAKANIPEEEKEFLKLAATRHIVFNYARIAAYYAHSNKEVQKLMEESALVIIDINDAIANGYVKLSKNIEKIMRATGRYANE